MDDWGWQELQPWLKRRLELPWARCSASSRVRQAADPGPPRPPARTAAHRRCGRHAPATRATSAPPRPRFRNGARGRPADRHPTPARTQQPRHHLRLPARHRQRRDHRHRPRPTRTDDPRQRITPTLKAKTTSTRSSRKGAVPQRGRGGASVASESANAIQPAAREAVHSPSSRRRRCRARILPRLWRRGSRSQRPRRQRQALGVASARLACRQPRSTRRSQHGNGACLHCAPPAVLSGSFCCESDPMVRSRALRPLLLARRSTPTARAAVPVAGQASNDGSARAGTMPVWALPKMRYGGTCTPRQQRTETQRRP
jgi:hypothetical protein